MEEWLNRRVSAEEYPAGDMPEYPAHELVQHVAAKGVQAGALVALVATPVVALLRRGRGGGGVYRPVQFWAVTVGLGVSSGMTYKKYVDGVLGPEGVDDRAYRLSKNAGQLKMDHYSVIGAGIGATGGAILGGVGLRSVLSGTVTGVALGSAVYIAEVAYAAYLEQEAAKAAEALK